MNVVSMSDFGSQIGNRFVSLRKANQTHYFFAQGSFWVQCQYFKRIHLVFVNKFLLVVLQHHFINERIYIRCYIWFKISQPSGFDNDNITNLSKMSCKNPWKIGRASCRERV